MKVWQVILFSAPLLGIGAYLSYRYSTSIPELSSVEKTLKSATLVSSVVVTDSSDLTSTIPLPEVQRTYVVHDVHEHVLEDLIESLRPNGWNEVYGGAPSNFPDRYADRYNIESPSIVYQTNQNEAQGSITLATGKSTPETPFGATPRSADPEYTTIYVRWVKNDPISKALALIKLK